MMFRWLKELWQEYRRAWREDCPHCGYYCRGQSVFCTKFLRDIDAHLPTNPEDISDEDLELFGKGAPKSLNELRKTETESEKVDEWRNGFEKGLEK